MSNYDLSIIIPSRNEMFLARTVADILKNKRGKTEVIVGLDGVWADPGVPDHKDVTLLYEPESIGQRAITNKCVRLSKAKWIMKVDAHCAFDEGFDVKVLEGASNNWTIVPVLYNLHGFNWKCTKCPYSFYQGPTPSKCEKCSSPMEREMIWKPRLSRKSTSYRFDTTLHFNYFGDYKKEQAKQGDFADTMSIQGSCFMLTREKYWELNICDENFGSWGQQGTEVACKTWLSGGEVKTNMKTWYSHLFRTQGGDFSFPYSNPENKIERARQISRDLFLNNKWDKQIYPLSWLIDKFKPVPDWHEHTGKKVYEMVLQKGEEFYNARGVKVESPDRNLNSLKPYSKGILYFTDNQLNLKIAHKVQKQLRSVGLPIFSVSLKPMPHFGKNIYLPLKRGVLTYFMQILTGLQNATTDIIFMCEHDVLYHPSHFDYTPQTDFKFYYNQNFWRVRLTDDFAVHWDANQVSGLVAYRETLIKFYEARIQEILEKGFNRSYEPGGRNSELAVAFMSEYPNIDIRHKGTLTRDKWSPKDFRDKSTCVNWQEGKLRDIPGWNFEASVL